MVGQLIIGAKKCYVWDINKKSFRLFHYGCWNYLLGYKNTT